MRGGGRLMPISRRPEVTTQQPHRPSMSGTTGYSQHPQYTQDTTALDQWVRWADDNGVIAPTLIPRQWVRTNAPQSSFLDESLKVRLQNGIVTVLDTRTGESVTFTECQQAAES